MLESYDPLGALEMRNRYTLNLTGQNTLLAISIQLSVCINAHFSFFKIVVVLVIAETIYSSMSCHLLENWL